MKSNARFVVFLLCISACFSLEMNRINGENENDDLIPPDTAIARIKSEILSGSDPFANITTKPSFIHGNEANSCYPAEYFFKTPNWWGNGLTPIPQNTIFKKDSRGCNKWGPCTVTAGEVGVFYFPTGSDATSYMTEVYHSELQYTFKSPTVYLVLQTAWGWATDTNLASSALRPTPLPANKPLVLQTSMPTPMLDPAALRNSLQAHESLYASRLASFREKFYGTQDTSGQESHTSKVTVSELKTPKSTLTTPGDGHGKNFTKPTSVVSAILLETNLQSKVPPTKNKRGVADLEQDNDSVWAMPAGGVGQLGPTIASKIFAFRLRDLSTLHPYSNMQEQHDMFTRQLQLSDLYSDCPTTADFKSLSRKTHPLIGDRDYRCFPRFSVPRELLREWGRPWWNDCRVLNMKKGLVDPPIALTLATKGITPTKAADPSRRPGILNPLPSKTYTPGSSTTSTDSGNTTPVESIDTSRSTDPVSSSSILSPGNVENPGISPESRIPDQPPAQVSSNSHNAPTSEIPIPVQEVDGGTVSISFETNSEDERLLPLLTVSGGSTLQSGNGPFSIPTNDESRKNVYVSVAAKFGKLEDVGDDNQQEGRTSMLSTLETAPAKSQDIGGQLKEIAPHGPSKSDLPGNKMTAVYMGVTLVQGEVRTASNVVFSYGLPGVVVEYPGGAVSTFHHSPTPAAKRPNTQPVSINRAVAEGMSNGRYSQNSVSSLPNKVESVSAPKASSSTNGTNGAYSKEVTITAFINTATTRNSSPDNSKAPSSTKKNGCGVSASVRSFWLIIVVISFGVYLEIC